MEPGDGAPGSTGSTEPCQGTLRSMVPGQVILKGDTISFNDPPVGWPPSEWPSGRPWRHTVRVRNNGDRAIQVGSHFHFYEANPGFSDTDTPPPQGNVGYRPRGLVVVDEKDVEVSEEKKKELTMGYRLDIPAGTARRFEPGYSCDVPLVALSGEGTVLGLSTRGTLRQYVWTKAPEEDSAAQTDPCSVREPGGSK